MYNYEDIYTQVSSWIRNSNFKGFDPYDIKSKPLVLRISKHARNNTLAVATRELLFELFYTYPKASRTLLGVKKEVNAKAMGLIAQSHLQFYQVSNQQDFFNESLQCLQWLEDNKVELNGGIGWGYPFSWYSNQLIPKYTPNGIVTTAAGEAFWEMYRHKKDPKYLEICKGISTFLASLPIHETEPDKICFSYTPLYQNHVHNLNLFVAEFLIKVGKETGNNEWIGMGLKAVNYTIANQRADGSFDYNGPPEKPNNFVDNYHTGFVLRMLHSIWKLTDNNAVFVSLERCFNHYVENFFEEEKIPKLLPHRKYRIDIHSCAESVNCLSILSETFPEGLSLAEDILGWTIENLYSNKGYFYYGILKSRFTGIPFKSKIAYLRWGQAWMLKALSSFIAAKNRAN